jgi:hypothetical protein
MVEFLMVEENGVWEKIKKRRLRRQWREGKRGIEKAV